MDRLRGNQLSLIAENIHDLDLPRTDWAIDTSPIQNRSIEDIRSEFVRRANGGQAQSKSEPPQIDGGQAELKSEPPQIDGGQAGWIEVEVRKGGSYKYRRWRDRNGIKRSQYLGVVK